MPLNQVVQGLTLHEANDILAEIEHVHGHVEVHKISVSSVVSEALTTRAPEGRVEAYSVALNKAQGYLIANPGTPLCLYDFYPEDLCQHLDIVAKITPEADRRKQEQDMIVRNRVQERENEIRIEACRMMKCKEDATRVFGLFSDLNNLVGFRIFELPDTLAEFMSQHISDSESDFPTILLATARKAELLVNEVYRFASENGAYPSFPETREKSKAYNELYESIDLLNSMHIELMHQDMEQACGFFLNIKGSEIYFLRHEKGERKTISTWSLTSNEKDVEVIDQSSHECLETEIPMRILTVDDKAVVKEGGEVLRNPSDSVFYDLVNHIAETTIFFPNENYPAFPFEFKNESRFDTGYLGDCTDYYRDLMDNYKPIFSLKEKIAAVTRENRVAKKAPDSSASITF